MADGVVYHTNPMSRGRIARWMLEEVGAPYERRIIQYGADLQTPGYIAINPMRKLPALTHGDAVVTETAAIVAYLADAFPDAGLAPAPSDRAAYYRWLFFCAGPMEAAMGDAGMKVSPNPEQARFVGYGEAGRMLDALDDVVRDGFVAGDRFTAADLYLAAVLGFGMRFGLFEERPAFIDYHARMTDRDAYKRVAALDDADMAAMNAPDA